MPADEEWTDPILEFAIPAVTSVSQGVPLDFSNVLAFSLLPSGTGGGGDTVCEDDRPDTGMLYPRG